MPWNRVCITPLLEEAGGRCFWAVVEIFHLYRCRGTSGGLSAASCLIFELNGLLMSKSMKRHSRQQSFSEKKDLFELNLAVDLLNVVDMAIVHLYGLFLNRECHL